ncbi:L-aspartate oxidase [Thermospira aquatica]|uniref:L-aspartate oxidase n=1 Tax=Thermospira aquatica TaxID=2828656 RepID=A0AAX3BD46_9SPIR|nr:L-aspartate oxidase [Thermospira aquatica]URA10167.1 L-aspartate oxidase [Thermospira aquatica]
MWDALVIGTGIAGSTTAYLLAKQGFSVLALTKTNDPLESNTYYAQGGIVYKGPGDSPELLMQDILQAGAGIVNPEAARIVATEAQVAVNEVLIEAFGIDFSRNDTGGFDLTEEGAHSVRRILHALDSTGKTIQEAAISALKKIGIEIRSSYHVIDIITLDHHTRYPQRMYLPPTVLGVYAYNQSTGKVEKLLAKNVILATGGMGQLYLHTTNPRGATGDGYAMAYRAGARLINMEYTQFHPTTLFHPKADNFLISEAVRGEGAVLINKYGEAFMGRYHPQKDLAPRDIVTRAILSEMYATQEPCVYLDIARLGKEKIQSRFPTIYRKCLDYRIDITVDPVPVVPAYHFSCGGVYTDMEGRTTIQRLYAVGEVACTGLHGANRLASTSLLEGVVFGRRIALFLGRTRESWYEQPYQDIPEWKETGTEELDPALIYQDWALLKNMMWNYVGAVRTKKRLKRALVDLKNLREDVEDFYRDARISPEIIELRNAVQTGLIVAQHAWTNRESRGAHYRLDSEEER